MILNADQHTQILSDRSDGDHLNITTYVFGYEERDPEHTDFHFCAIHSFFHYTIKNVKSQPRIVNY